MEFSATQLAIINAIMPFKYKIETSCRAEPKPVKAIHRKSEAENLMSNLNYQSRLPEKRPGPEIVKSQEPVKLNEGGKKLLKILNDLKQHPKISSFWDFVTRKSFPEFNERFNNCFDLATVELRLLSGTYLNGYSFALDVRKLWNNSFSFFAGNSDVYSLISELSDKFENLIVGMDDVVVQTAPQKASVEKNEKVEKTKEDRIEKSEKSEKVEKSEKALKVIQNKPENPIRTQDKPLGYFEKKQLCDNIKKLEPRYLKGVLDIVKDCTDMKGKEFEFDIDRLPPSVCRELDKYVKSCIGNKSVKKIEEVKKEVKLPEPQKNDFKSDVYLPEPSESESSSTSESEEEEVPSTGFFSREDDFEFTNGFGNR
jgi:hypothetical protein